MKSKEVSVIVDADIARASGLSEHPVSSGSRAMLEAIRKQGHRIALCPKLRAEWRKHQSKFAIGWLSSMTAARKVVTIDECNNISDSIALLKVADGLKAIAQKDAHLVDGALVCNKIIASNDSTARHAFSVISKQKKQIENIFWLNAVADSDFIKEEGMSFSKIPKTYQLKSHAEKAN